jgi:hypothetical protein
MPIKLRSHLGSYGPGSGRAGRYSGYFTSTTISNSALWLLLINNFINAHYIYWYPNLLTLVFSDTSYTTRIFNSLKWLSSCVWLRRKLGKDCLENELSGILRSTNHGLRENSTPPNMYCYAFLTAAGLELKLTAWCIKIRGRAEIIPLLNYGSSKLSALRFSTNPANCQNSRKCNRGYFLFT